MMGISAYAPSESFDAVFLENEAHLYLLDALLCQSEDLS